MAQTTQQPRNLPNNAAPKRARMSDDERLAKAREARMAAIPPAERKLMETSETLRAQIKAEKDAEKIKTLRAALTANERERKAMAFVRKAALVMIDVKDVARQITLLADTNNYRASPAQRGKVYTLFTSTLAAALEELKKLPPEAEAEDETDNVTRKRNAIDDMAAMLAE